MSDESRLKGTLFVGGLSPAVNSSILHTAFIPFGEIVDISLPKPEAPNSPELHRGFGYVEFETAQDAREAMDNMDQSELFGRVIKVNPAKERKDKDEGLGSRTAVWEQEGYLSKHAVNEEDRLAIAPAQDEHDVPMDPMQGLEGLDVAGPKAV